jgi:hypothetical protein
VRLFLISLNPPIIYSTIPHFFSASACTCPGEDHPGPSVTTGRGAPEIDILEAGGGGVVSQSAPFAPFTHDYVYLNDTEQEWYVYNPDISQPNSYKYVFTSSRNTLLMTYGRGDPLSVAYISFRPFLTNFVTL